MCCVLTNHSDIYSNIVTSWVYNVRLSSWCVYSVPISINWGSCALFIYETFFFYFLSPMRCIVRHEHCWLLSLLSVYPWNETGFLKNNPMSSLNWMHHASRSCRRKNLASLWDVAGWPQAKLAIYVLRISISLRETCPSSSAGTAPSSRWWSWGQYCAQAPILAMPAPLVTFVLRERCVVCRKYTPRFRNRVQIFPIYANTTCFPLTLYTVSVNQKGRPNSARLCTHLNSDLLIQQQCPPVAKSNRRLGRCQLESGGRNFTRGSNYAWQASVIRGRPSRHTVHIIYTWRMHVVHIVLSIQFSRITNAAWSFRFLYN